MTRWTTTIGIGLLTLFGLSFAAPDISAQTPGGAFEQLSPGNQKIARALFESQRSQLPPGTRPLTLDEIATRKQSGEGWGRVHAGMKSQGLTDSRNLGQAVSSHNHRQHLSSTSPRHAVSTRPQFSSSRALTTASNRTIPQGRAVNHGNGVNAGRGADARAAGGQHRQNAIVASKAPVHADRAASNAGGGGHGRGRGK